MRHSESPVDRAAWRGRSSPSSWRRTKASRTARGELRVHREFEALPVGGAAEHAHLLGDAAAGSAPSTARRARRTSRGRGRGGSCLRGGAGARPPSGSRCRRGRCPAARARCSPRMRLCRTSTSWIVPHEGVPHVQRAGHVGRRHRDRVRRARVSPDRGSRGTRRARARKRTSGARRSRARRPWELAHGAEGSRESRRGNSMPLRASSAPSASR